MGAQDGEISHRVLTPEADFGVVPVPLDQWEAELIVGGSSEQRAEAFRAVLSGQTNGLRKFIVINCAVALWVAGEYHRSCSLFDSILVQARQTISRLLLH